MIQTADTIGHTTAGQHNTKPGEESLRGKSNTTVNASTAMFDARQGKDSIRTDGIAAKHAGNAVPKQSSSTGTDRMTATTADMLAPTSTATEALHPTQVYSFTPATAAEFIASAFPDFTQMAGSTHTASAADVFGPSSTLAPHDMCNAWHSRSQFTGSSVFQGLVLVVAAAYIVLLARYLTEAYTLVRRTLTDSSKHSRIFDSQSGSYIRFINLMTATGLSLTGIAVVKYADVHIGSMLETSLHSVVVPVTAVMATAIFALIVLAQTVMLRIVGGVTLTQKFISDIFYLRRTYFSMLVMSAAPAILLYALCPPDTGHFWSYVTALISAVTIILYLKETLLFFISKKISILHWFLYLCGVEIFPFSLAWLLIVRN